MRFRSAYYIEKKYGIMRGQIEYATYKGVLEKFERRRGSSGCTVFYVDEDEARAKLDVLKDLPELRYMYMTSVMRKYGLTRNQIREAIKRGLLNDYHVVRNPYHSGSESILINPLEVEKKLDEIKALPKYSMKEIERRRLYKLRSKARNRLSFKCPRCSIVVRPLRDSAAFELYWGEEVSLEDARRALIIAHYRHHHTNYYEERRRTEKWLSRAELLEFREALKRYEEAKERRSKEEREYWLEVVREFKDKAVKRARKYYTELAVKLAREDGLLD